MGEKTGLNFSGAKCAVCGTNFSRSVKSTKAVCSAECKRERSRKYARDYYQKGRFARRDASAMFGGQTPTTEDFLQIIQQRKGPKS